MASIFGHAAVAATLHYLLPSHLRSAKAMIAGVFCSAIPDADIIAFRFGIPYEHMFGHRGITHSLFFSLLLPWIIIILLHSTIKTKDKWVMYGYYFACTLSHAILDACTTGGRGVALWAPISDQRIFLPFRVIQVSPIRASQFFSDWGVAVIKSEFIWIGIPSVMLCGIIAMWRKAKS